jgi:hypothetical protein
MSKHVNKYKSNWILIIEGKISRHSVMDTVSLHVLTKLIRDFSDFTVSSCVLFHSLARCANTTNNICM